MRKGPTKLALADPSLTGGQSRAISLWNAENRTSGRSFQGLGAALRHRVAGSRNGKVIYPRETQAVWTLLLYAKKPKKTATDQS